MKLFSLFNWVQDLVETFTFYGGGKGGGAPPAPDYTGAAQATAAGNLEAAKYTAEANRVNQVTPYGSLTYSQAPENINQAGYDAAMRDYQTSLNNYNNALSQASSRRNNSLYGGGIFGNQSSSVNVGPAPVAPNIKDYTTQSNQWTATQTLSPAQQQILDQTTALNSGLLGTAQSGLSYANDILSKPGVDTSKLAQVGINPGQTYQDAMMARLAPQIDRENAALEQQLANRGIAAGTDAYNQAKMLQAQNQNDRLNSAVVQGFNTGLAANQQGFQQEAYNQMQPINVINALRTGSQVQNPNFVNVPQQAQTAGADILGATNASYQNQLNAYNAQQAQQGNFLGGLMNLGGTIYKASDIKLKKYIKKIGTLSNGLNVYKYHYKKGFGLPQGEQIGVMAQEVEKVIPKAVITMANGYKAVNYALI
jgi:hypothetical protein